MCIFGHDGRFMFIGLRPVAGIVGIFSSRIRETQFYPNLSRRKQRRNNLCTDFILETIACSNNGFRLAVESDSADYLAVGVWVGGWVWLGGGGGWVVGGGGGGIKRRLKRASKA